ncbi:unnamed protein product [Moneuplotes crassus]|uniref:Uncharacterized protein n=1 Tax=Euplotes crassus TaxID=5936 RepID=A0AAD1XCU4_EUPCR|nr:unnamed protein product [Moneuplotes crassus]
MRKRLFVSLLAIIIYRSGNRLQLATEIINLFDQHKTFGFFSVAVIILSYLNKHGYLRSLSDSSKLLREISKIFWNEMSLTPPTKPLKKNERKVDKEVIKDCCQNIDVINYMKLLKKAKSKKEAKKKLMEVRDIKMQQRGNRKHKRGLGSQYQSSKDITKALLPIQEEAVES